MYDIMEKIVVAFLFLFPAWCIAESFRDDGPEKLRLFQRIMTIIFILAVFILAQPEN